MRICFAHKTPITVRIMPLYILNIIAVCTVSDKSLSFFAPKYLATKTLAPIESPIKKLVRRLISAVLEPTAASALSPANLPTTIISAALNNN